MYPNYNPAVFISILSLSFDIGPKRYIHIRRLSAVRQQILSRDSRETVTDIANYWGFWHMGQFAADYRRHFGEAPSDTKARAHKRILV